MLKDTAGEILGKTVLISRQGMAEFSFEQLSVFIYSR